MATNKDVNSVFKAWALSNDAKATDSDGEVSGSPTQTKIWRKSGALAKGMQAFLNQPELSDVLLRFAGKQYRAHRLVLAAWSSVLEERLAEGVQVMVLDCDADWPEGVPRPEPTDGDAALLQVLRFLYTGQATLAPATVWPVLTLARAYGIGGLQELCEDHLAGEISLHNVEAATRWLDRAEREGLAVLQQSCLQVLRAYLQQLPEPLWLGLRLDQVVAIIEGDDVVVDNEYALFMKIEMWIRSKQEAGEGDWQSALDKIVPHLRFAHMTARQLQRVGQSQLGGPIHQRWPLLLAEALQSRALAAEEAEAEEGEEQAQPRELRHARPRLYLAFAPPGNQQRASVDRQSGVYQRMRCSAGSSLVARVFVKGKGDLYRPATRQDCWTARLVPREKSVGDLWRLEIQLDSPRTTKGVIRVEYRAVAAIKAEEDSPALTIVTQTGTVSSGNGRRDTGRSTDHNIKLHTPHCFMDKPKFVYAVVMIYID